MRGEKSLFIIPRSAAEAQIAGEEEEEAHTLPPSGLFLSYSTLGMEKFSPPTLFLVSFLPLVGSEDDTEA